MHDTPGASGLAALAIRELLLFSLTESKMLAARFGAILEDAAAASRNAIPLAPDDGPHKAAARVIELILAGGNSVRFE